MQEVARREMPSENNQEDGKYFAYNIFLHASQRNLNVMGFERRWREMSPSGGTTRWILFCCHKGLPWMLSDLWGFSSWRDDSLDFLYSWLFVLTNYYLFLLPFLTSFGFIMFLFTNFFFLLIYKLYTFSVLLILLCPKL